MFPGRSVIFLRGKLNNNVGRPLVLFPGYFQHSVFKTHARTLFLDPHHGWSIHMRKSDTHPSYKWYLISNTVKDLPLSCHNKQYARLWLLQLGPKLRNRYCLPSDHDVQAVRTNQKWSLVVSYNYTMESGLLCSVMYPILGEGIAIMRVRNLIDWLFLSGHMNFHKSLGTSRRLELSNVLRFCYESKQKCVAATGS